MEIKRFGYFWLDTWVLANVIQLATQEFCMRHLNRKNDPCGRQYDQMTQAARASLAELGNDYLNWLLLGENVPWSVNSEEHLAVTAVQLDRPTYKDDVQHLSCIHILAQKRKFDRWLRSGDSIVEANCLLVLCHRLILMLNKQLANLLASFKEEGGFTETLTAERLAYRTAQSIKADAPKCPKCGKPMIKRVAKRGLNAGNEFWSCSGYPDCNGTRNM